MSIERIIAALGEKPGDPDTGRRLRVFQSLLALHLIAEHINLSALFLPSWDAWVWFRLLAAGLAAGLVLFSEVWARGAMALLAALQLFYTWLLFPMSANHTFLELYLAALAAGLGGRGEEDRAQLLGMLRWTAVVILFYSGLQKLLYGYYFRGEMLAFLISRREGFADFLGLLLPAGEAARLSALTLADGQGPYRVPPGPLWIVSNATYLLELALPVGLVVVKTRAFAAAATLALILAIELCAHEFYFGMLFLAVLSLYAPPRATRHLVWPAAAIYLWMVAVRLEWIGGPFFN